MNAPTGSFAGTQGFEPLLGPRFLPYNLDFSSVASFDTDLQRSQTHGKIDFVQSVFIDNSQNQAALTLIFQGTGQRIVCPALQQGDYPVKIGSGIVRFNAATSQGQIIPVIFSNMPALGTTWGPTPGANIVPALTNIPLNFAPLAAGDNQLVAAVPLQTIKVYRLFYTVAAGTIITLKDGAGAAWTGALPTFAGGGAAFQASGIPWFTTGIGQSLVLNSTNAVNLGGALGYQQS